MYKIRKNLDKHRVLVSFEGEFDEDVDQFETEMKDAALGVRSPTGHFDLLADFRNAPAMSQDRAQRSEALVAWCMTKGLRKAASLMNTTIQRMQVKRVSAKDDRFQYFDSVQAAERWLDG